MYKAKSYSQNFRNFFKLTETNPEQPRPAENTPISLIYTYDILKHRNIQTTPDLPNFL